MRKYLLSVAVMAGGCALLTGCLGESNNGSDEPVEVVVTNGALIVNNGNMSNGIDGSLTYIDYEGETAQQNVYRSANGTSLGETPNDVLVYGNKIYVVGSGENTVFVLDKKTFKEIERISTTSEMGDEEGFSPRTVIGYGANIYVSTYGGYVAQIDTTYFGLRNKYKVGSYPEGMAIGTVTSSNGTTTTATLYVANSDYGYGNASISKVDLASGTVTEIRNEKIRNPQQLAVGGETIFVLDWGYYDENWQQKEAGVYVIEGTNVAKIIPDATGMAAAGYNIVTFNYPYGATTATYSIYNVAYGSLSSFHLSGDSQKPVFSPAAISVDPNSGYVLIASREKDPDTGYASYKLPGYVNMYQGNGSFVKTYATGVEPHSISYNYGTLKYQNGQLMQ